MLYRLPCNLTNFDRKHLEEECERIASIAGEKGTYNGLRCKDCKRDIRIFEEIKQQPLTLEQLEDLSKKLAEENARKA